MIPAGLCQCGCGAATTQVTRTIRGVPPGGWQRFVMGHSSRTRDPKAPYRRIGDDGKSRCIHVVNAESALGRSLPAGAEVHHVDGDKKNNANTNLVICQNHAYHALLHVRASIVRAGGNPNTQNLCHACGLCKDFSEFYPSMPRKCRLCQQQRDARRWTEGKFKSQRRSAGIDPRRSNAGSAQYPATEGGQ